MERHLLTLYDSIMAAPPEQSLKCLLGSKVSWYPPHGAMNPFSVSSKPRVLLSCHRSFVPPCANAASDIEFHMPFGFKEVEGIHSRTNFDLLRQHLEAGDMAKISKLAHKMIPMFKQFGIREITPLLVFLERMDAAAVDRENVAETVAAILEKGPEVADLIRREVGLPE